MLVSRSPAQATRVYGMRRIAGPPEGAMPRSPALTVAMNAANSRLASARTLAASGVATVAQSWARSVPGAQSKRMERLLIRVAIRSSCWGLRSEPVLHWLAQYDAGRGQLVGTGQALVLVSGAGKGRESPDWKTACT